MNRALIVCASLALLSTPCLAQEKKPTPTEKRASLAPEWKVGEWWEVAVDLKTRSLREARRPKGPNEFASRPLPGLALEGPQPGYVEVARWRLQVVRTKRFHHYEGEDNQLRWKLGWFVEARRIDKGERNPTSLTLVFVGAEKALSDMAIHHPGRKVRWINFDADAYVTPPIEAAVCLFPLAWPDLRTGKVEKRLDSRERAVTQVRREDRSGVHLVLRTKDGDRARVRWRAKEPWPKLIRGEGFVMRLRRSSRD